MEAGSARIAGVRRRFRCETTEELLARAADAREELAALAEGRDPVAAAAAAVEAAQARVDALHDTRFGRPGLPRSSPSPPRSPRLRGVGMGDGEFVPSSGSATRARGGDEVVFLVRPNRGLPFAPVAETASGGELSRIALAIAAVAGGETMVFDEIDAGIGGTTAHAVARALRRLADRAQVITITCRRSRASPSSTGSRSTATRRKHTDRAAGGRRSRGGAGSGWQEAPRFSPL